MIVAALAIIVGALVAGIALLAPAGYVEDQKELALQGGSTIAFACLGWLESRRYRRKPFCGWGYLWLQAFLLVLIADCLVSSVGVLLNADALRSLSYITAPLLAVTLIGEIVSSRRRQGRCDTCGYDLTGNVSGVCPECGTAIKRPDDGQRDCHADCEGPDGRPP